MKKNEETTYPYIYVEKGGSYRELTDEEQCQLQEKLSEQDGEKKYLKKRFRSRSSDGNVEGFCCRKKVPNGLAPGQKPKRKKKKKRSPPLAKDIGAHRSNAKKAADKLRKGYELTESEIVSLFNGYIGHSLKFATPVIPTKL